MNPFPFLEIITCQSTKVSRSAYHEAHPEVGLSYNFLFSRSELDIYYPQMLGSGPSSVGILLQMPDGSRFPVKYPLMCYIHRSTKLNWAISSSNPVGGDRASQAAERDCWESLFRGDQWGYGGGIWWRGFLVWFYCMHVSMLQVLSPCISNIKICFSSKAVESSSCKPRPLTVGKFQCLESNLCPIEGLPTCNLDKCKVS